mmetsp:Transcript_10500/g.14493  ORF Transcript_10500/g.14493 Transcript_10500/m.14493 type:complete len:239 (+) Transcript_10500:174-890(+)
MMTKGLRKSWFEIIISCLILQFGGTTLTGVLLGQTPSWIISKSALPAFLIMWWLTFFSPFDIYWNTIPNNPVLLFFIGIGSSLSSAHAVGSWGVDKALFNAFHVNTQQIRQSLYTCIFCGTLSASGGGMIAEWFNLFGTGDSTFTTKLTPKIFAIEQYKITATLNRSFLLSILYLSFIRADFSKQFGHAVLALLQVIHFLTQQMVPSIDIFQDISFLVLQCLGIKSVIDYSSTKLKKK